MTPKQFFGDLGVRLKAAKVGEVVNASRAEITTALNAVENRDPFGNKDALKKIVEDGRGSLFGRQIALLD